MYTGRRRARALRSLLALGLLAGALGVVGPAPSPVEAQTSAPDCGTRVVKTTSPRTYWECTFVDNFSGSKLDTTKWMAQTTAISGFGSGDDCYVDDPDNIKVTNGRLRLSVIKEKAPFTCESPMGDFQTRYTSAEVMTYTKFSQAFGRFEFRAKFPASKVKGLHGALWLWPDNPVKYGGWPFSGEIDVAEVFSQYNDRAIPFVHYMPYRPSQTNNYCTISVTNFHTYVLEWTTTNIKITFDGKVCVNEKISPTAPLVAPQPFDQPFMLALMQGLGVGGNRLDPAKPPPFPAAMEVDWVKVWK